MSQFDLIATATFGLENVVARELRELGYTDCRISDGRVHFRGTSHDIARCNLWLRSADRLLLRVGEFPAPDFGALFDQTIELPWTDLLPVDACFPVKGRSVRSKLHAVPKVQGVVKKAIVESLKRKHNRFRFEESGVTYPVEISLLKDVATLTIDTSGPGLHKRGYRTHVGAAPLRETMAAALVQLSFWNPERPLIDPFCGSGTILIEAAMIARNMAPGLQRSFVSEDFQWIDRDVWRQARREAREVRIRNAPAPILGFDHNPDAIRLSRRAATQAGVAGDIQLHCQELSDLSTPLEYGCVITNPPYGERLGEDEQVKATYRVMADVFARMPTWSFYVLTSHKEFERQFGRRAEKRRKLYNGRLQCQYYQYPGPRPPATPIAEFDSTATDINSRPDTEGCPAVPPEPADAAQPQEPSAASEVRVLQPGLDPFQTFVADCAPQNDATLPRTPPNT